MYDQDVLANQILLEQFLGDLENRTQSWVQQYLPQNCEKALQLAFAVSEGEYAQEQPVRSQGGTTPREGGKKHSPSKIGSMMSSKLIVEISCYLSLSVWTWALFF